VCGRRLFDHTCAAGMNRALLSLTVSTLEDQGHQRMPADISIARRACKHGGVARPAPGRG
jgi:hypothetical protein